MHRATQQARAVHEEGRTKGQQQRCRMRRARLFKFDKIFNLLFFKLLPIVCRFSPQNFLSGKEYF